VPDDPDAMIAAVRAYVARGGFDRLATAALTPGPEQVIDGWNIDGSVSQANVAESVTQLLTAAADAAEITPPFAP
jgi:hypothetical protein